MRLSHLRFIAFAICLLFLAGSGLAKDKKKKVEKEDTSRLKSGTFSGLEMRGIGPALMSGRIADIAIHPKDQSVWYVAVGSGGVWLTENAGTTWKSIFDKQVSYSIGCITIDPSRPEVVWVGTGENVGGRHVGYGDGVYRSLDGGKSWENMGLKASEHIGNIVVDPRNSDVVYVAAQGPLWSGGGDRGLYKTTDGGKNWEKILGGGEYTGVNEVWMDPRDSNVLYAATHQRLRTVAALMNGGPESGIHKSMDGGKTWRELKNGIPGEDKGKIGLAISPQNPDVVYATIELAHRKGGFYRSEDGGGSWEKRNDYLSGGTGPHYYQEIFASPHQLDRVYQMDASMRWTEDGGKTFKPVGEQYKHGDNHIMAFDPNDPNYLLSGSDGGIYESWDLGKTWKFIANLPVTQFYKVAVDYAEPFYNVYGGTQDNNTQGGPSRTDNNIGIRNADWFITLFADGHQPAVDPTNPNIIYSEWQEGNLVRFDKKTGEIVYISPQSEDGDVAERHNWDSPILLSPHNPARLYYASQRVWRSEDRGDSWELISPDLSRNEDRMTMPMMGRVWSYDSNWDMYAMSNYGTITSLAESPLVEGLLYAGTDDGLVQVSEDGGKNWRKIEVSTMPGVPQKAFVNDIKADLHNADTVYVVLDNHKNGDFKPYVMKSVDRGLNWTSISSDLPERHLVWRLVQDHVKPELLFLGTEFGVFFSINGGGKWIKLTGGAPNISFRDLVIQKRENDLVGATFGRGFYILDDYTPLRHITEENLESDSMLFPVKDALWYVPKRPLGRGNKATQGAGYFTAENPPFGAIFTYYMRDGLTTAKATRKKAEKKLIKEGKDTPFPGWDAIRAEEMEAKPKVTLTVRDSKGDVVRRITAPATPGFNRVAWDLRHESKAAWRPSRGGGGYNPFGSGGSLAAPGDYSVTFGTMVDGVLTESGEPQKFTVKRLGEPTIEGMKPHEMSAFMLEVETTQGQLGALRSILEETTKRLEAIQSVLVRTPKADPALYKEAHELLKTLHHMDEALDGSELHEDMGEPVVQSISSRLGIVGMGTRMSTYGPTANLLRSYEIAKKGLQDQRTILNEITNQKLPALEKKLDEAGAPWTPGRGLK